MNAPAYKHKTVLLEPTVAALGLDEERTSAGVWVDGTFGRGGHSRLALKKMRADDSLIVFDKDPEAIQEALSLAVEDPRVKVVHAGFAEMKERLAALGITQVQGIMLDIGVSSPQIDNPERGFSFMRNGPLDMRMDSTQGITARDWLVQASQDEIKEVIQKYGEERFAFQIAKAIKARLASQPIATTSELAELVASVVRTREKGQHPATRTFQALRIFVNQELAQLAHGLAATLSCLAPGGRLAVISFHSLEDRLVKQFIQLCQKPDQLLDKRIPLREVDRPQPILNNAVRIKPSEEEVVLNPRSRSAVLRVAQRTETPLPAEGVGKWLANMASFKEWFGEPRDLANKTRYSGRRGK